MIPILVLVFSPLTLWIPTIRRFTVICTTISRYYSGFMFRLHMPLLHNTRIDIIRTRLFRVPNVLRARLGSRREYSLMDEFCFQQLSMLVF
uniref:Secreted protein n=1 Tax=Picea sitchensis TaxID=3332 RepID=A9NXF0_PICSI|nr:unknown [Picea sitchensis]ACN41020.1 unknown [Picea sitchensis]